MLQFKSTFARPVDLAKGTCAPTPLWETGHWNGNCSGLHIYNDIGKLVLRKPDDRAPADTSTLPKALDAIGSKHPPLGGLCTYPAPKMCGARSRPRLHEGSIDLTGVGLDFDEAPSRLPLLL